MFMERIKTGIKGFDTLVGGGFPKGSSILVSGTPGTGKTIFALQFLYNGATLFNEKGLYVTFEEKDEELKNQAMQFGWDLDALQKKGNFRVLSIAPSNISKSTVKEIVSIIKKFNIKRLILDSLSTLSLNTPTTNYANKETSEIMIQRFIYSFIDELKKLNEATSLLISSTPNEKSLSRDSISEFICDGIVYILYESLGGEYSRSLTIRKMRRTKNDDDIHPMEIGSEGLIIHRIN